FTDPLRHLHSFPTRRSSDLLSRKQVEALSGHPSFREPLERFFCAQLTGKRFTISRKQATRMPRSRAGRLAILMMTEPLGEVERRSEEHTSELQSREKLVCRL